MMDTDHALFPPMQNFAEWLRSKPENEAVGRPSNKHFCPIANFMKDTGFAERPEIGFGNGFWSPDYKKPSLMYRMPGWACEFMVAIDSGQYIWLTADDCLVVLNRIPPV